jgi:hypothetical protein
LHAAWRCDITDTYSGSVLTGSSLDFMQSG